MNLMRKQANQKGRFAESMAAFYLRLKGYSILHKRYKTPMGEVDLIAKRGSWVVFVEVKARQTLEEAVEAIRPQQQQRILKAAELYLSRTPQLAPLNLRFDAILLTPNSWPQHIVNAW